MIAYKIPSTEDGLLCALYEAFTLKERPFAVFSGAFQPSYDCKVKNITVFKNNAMRVKKGIIKCGGISLLSTLFYPLRSNDDLKETIIFNCAYKCLSARKDLTDNYSDADMLSLYELKHKISYEAHRMLGFVRFEKSCSGIWYAHIEPDNNIVDLIGNHFAKRFLKERFIIHDLKRNNFVAYDGKTIASFYSDMPITLFLSEEEEEFQTLWQTYFSSINIKERKNLKQQNNYLPNRYRSNMVEFLQPLKWDADD